MKKKVLNENCKKSTNLKSSRKYGSSKITMWLALNIHKNTDMMCTLSKYKKRIAV